MRRRTTLTAGALVVAGVLGASLLLSLQPSGSQSDREGGLEAILGPDPTGPAATAQRQARTDARAAVAAAARQANECIRTGLVEAGSARGLTLDVTLTDPAAVVADDDLALNWGYEVTGHPLTEAERSDFHLVASAIEIDCQTRLFDPAATAARVARRRDRTYMNHEARSLAACLRGGQQVRLATDDLRAVVKALADGSRPPEPLATRVNESPTLRDAVTRCLLDAPAIAGGATAGR
jgi:hypothetical protein